VTVIPAATQSDRLRRNDSPGYPHWNEKDKGVGVSGRLLIESKEAVMIRETSAAWGVMIASVEAVPL
jgi:hypothetical protein